jgi:hypothetical protein
MTDSKREYEELIERLGKLTGPKRSLNAAIWKITKPEEYRDYCLHRSALVNRAWSQDEKDKAVEEAAQSAAPEYTKSIEAAMTLGGLEVLQRSLERLLEQINSGTWKSGPEVTADDIARIICAEALRARSQ